MINKIVAAWKTYRQEVKKQQQIVRLRKAIRNPKLFTEGQRAYIKALFPKGWCHIDNLTQVELFKVGYTMSMLGYSVKTDQEFQFVFMVLKAQNIIEQPGDNIYLVRQKN